MRKVGQFAQRSYFHASSFSIEPLGAHETSVTDLLTQPLHVPRPEESRHIQMLSPAKIITTTTLTHIAM